MSTSETQRRFSRALSDEFARFTIRENSRPYWCVGSDLQRLELDFWIVELDVAVEIQGQQHYVYVSHFHRNYEGFIAQRERDEMKQSRCLKYGIELLEVDDEVTFSDALERIRQLSREYIKKSAVFRPEQWRQKIHAMKENMEKYFAHLHDRHHPQYGKSMAKITGQQNKLHSWLKKYGMAIFENASEEIVEKLFWYAEAAESVRNANTLAKKLRRKQIYEAKKDAGLL